MVVEIFQPTDKVQYLTIPKWQKLDKSLVVGFTTRNGGHSEDYFQSLNMGLHVADQKETVIENRRTLAKQLHFPLEKWVCGEQVHDNIIQMVTKNDQGKGVFQHETALSGVDGLITNEKDILLSAFYADCVPLLFFDPETSYIGVAHAGWRGTVKGIAAEMVKKFTTLGSKPENLIVTIGPCISKEKYIVNDKVVGHIAKAFHRVCVESIGNDEYLLDLKQLNKEILLQSGVLRHNIEVTNYCTYLDERLFYSHRRDQGRTGRMLAFIGFLTT